MSYSQTINQFYNGNSGRFINSCSVILYCGFTKKQFQNNLLEYYVGKSLDLNEF